MSVVLLFSLSYIPFLFIFSCSFYRRKKELSISFFSFLTFSLQRCWLKQLEDLRAPFQMDSI
jgi:hypothetical protein